MNRQVEAASTRERALTVGFVRGISPETWKWRWLALSHGQPIELIPLKEAYAASDPPPLDVVIERAQPELRPAHTDGDHPTRHAIRLYAEQVALVVAADHPFADLGSAPTEVLSEVPLLPSPAHAPEWPAPNTDLPAEWEPQTLPDALQLVATGTQGILLPLPLARHLATKRQHAIVRLQSERDDELPETTVWATWERARDADDVQLFVAALRGRTPRSSR